MTQPFPPQSPYGQQPPPGWVPPGTVPDPRQWQHVPPHAYPASPPPAPKKTRKWPWIVGGLFVLLFVVPALGNSGSSSSGTSTPSVPAQPARSLAAPSVSTVQETEEAPAGAAPGLKTSFEDGTWVVGEDIQPGAYKSSGAQEGLFELCSVTTHSDENADSGTTLDWKTANANEPIRLKLSGKVKSVKATGCEPFTKVG